MPALDRSNLVLSFEPEALERCYAVADVLEEVYDRPYLEYGLIGLVARSRPFHVVATRLLAGQDVTAGSVHQSGYNVLSMRHEIRALSKRLGLPLVPVAFIHRHPQGCEPSIIDDEFLAGTFVDQVSTVLSFKETTRAGAGDLHHACLDGGPAGQRSCPGSIRGPEVEVQFCVAFSLIVNRERDHFLYAVRKEMCRYCGEDQIRFVAAELTVSLRRTLSLPERNRIRTELQSEVAAKIRFEPSLR